MITSQNRPGLPDFSRVTLKNMGRPGDEASVKHVKHKLLAVEICSSCLASLSISSILLLKLLRVFYCIVLFQLSVFKTSTQY